MKSFFKLIPVMAVALMVFSLPILVDNGTIGQQNEEKGIGAQVVKPAVETSAAIACFPFICP